MGVKSEFGLYLNRSGFDAGFQELSVVKDEYMHLK